MTRPTPDPATGVSRRAALRLVALAPVALTATACSSAALDRLEAPRSTPPAPPNPDQPAVDAVIVATAGLLSALRSLGDKDPVDPALTALVTIHDAHLARLGPASAPAVAPVPRLDGSRAQVRSHEVALATLYAERAGTVESGQLARLLAAMSAAVSQRVAGLEA